MRKGLVWCFLIALLVGISTAAWADGAPGTELIQKGTFEDGTVDQAPPSPWVSTAPSGSSVKVAGEESPFPPATGTKDVLMEDNSQDAVVSLKQPFAEQSNVFLLLSVDVKLADANAQLAIRLGKEVAGSKSVYLLVSDSEGLRALDASGSEITLFDAGAVSPNTWYRIQAIIPGISSGVNPSGFYRVSLQPYNGSVSISGLVPFTGINPDPDVTRTGRVSVDNVSLKVMQDGTAPDPTLPLENITRRKLDVIIKDEPGANDIGAYGLAVRVLDSDMVDHASGYDASAGVFGVDNPSKFAVGDVVRVRGTGEILRVTAVDTAGRTITVIRGWAGSTAAAVNDNEELEILGFSAGVISSGGGNVPGEFTWNGPEETTLAYEKILTFTPKSPLPVGTYTLNVTSFDQAGNENQGILNFSITNAAPTANFTSSMTGVNTITFTDKSADDAGVAAWSWSFGDGATSNVQNPVHTYPAKGKYSVTLTVTDTDGATNSVTREIDLEKVNLEVDLLEPVGGERWIGGTHNIVWTARHPEGGNMWFTLQYSYDGGATWKDIVTDLDVEPDNAGNYTYQWDVSKVARGSDQFKVKVIAEGTGANPAEDESGIFTVIAVEKGKVSTGPNPARSHATFYYDFGSEGAQVRNGGSVSATLYIYDLSGRLVFTQELPVESNSFTWDLVNMHGDPVASGLYLWQINLPDGGAIGPKRLIVAR